MEFAIEFHLSKCVKFYNAGFGSATQSSTLQEFFFVIGLVYLEVSNERGFEFHQLNMHEM
jgi:hypothetical protein